MNKQTFKEIIGAYKTYYKRVLALNEEGGVNLLNAKFMEDINYAFFKLLASKFGEDGKEAIEWYIFDNKDPKFTADTLYDVVVRRRDYYAPQAKPTKVETPAPKKCECPECNDSRKVQEAPKIERKAEPKTEVKSKPKTKAQPKVVTLSGEDAIRMLGQMFGFVMPTIDGKTGV